MTSGDDFERDARQLLAGQLARPALLVGIGLGVLLIFGLWWKSGQDAKRDGRIQELTRQITADSVVRDSLTRRSEALAINAGVRVEVFRDGAIRWRTLTDTLSLTVTQIVRDTTLADSSKVRQLVAVIETLTLRADSVVAAGELVAASAVDLRGAVAEERAAWAKERGDQATKIRLLARQSRHFGLGLALGYGAMRDAGGVIRAGPVLTVGLVYRW